MRIWYDPKFFSDIGSCTSILHGFILRIIFVGEEDISLQEILLVTCPLRKHLVYPKDLNHD